jgi:hypothetical protein
MDQLQTQLQYIRNALDAPFWQRHDFQISAAIGLLGLLFSFLAFIQAKKAKKAATFAGRTVKMSSVAGDLAEISIRLGKLDPEITFFQAHDLINEVSGKIHYVVAIFANDTDLEAPIKNVLTSLTAAYTSLNGVVTEPGAEQQLAPRAIYYAIRSDLFTLGGFVAELRGRMEGKATHTFEPYKRNNSFRRLMATITQTQPKQ